MTFRVFIALAITLLTGNGYAQDKSTFRAGNIHIGLVYPVSTNGVDAVNYSNHFSLHALAGVSAAEDGFCASGVGNVILHDGNGVVLGGSANIILGSAGGVSAAGFINYVGETVDGVQAAGFANVTKNCNGLQAGGFSNINLQYLDGAQLGGFANYTNKIDGFQGAGFANISKQANGTQVAGFINVVKKIDGVQVAGYINIAEKVNTQVAGFVNVAGEVKGAQICGFINIADSCAWPVGLVNISRTGEQFIGVTINDNSTTIISFRSGGKYLYGIIGAGVNFSYKRYEPLYAAEAGLGGHIPISKTFRLNAELSVVSLSDYWTTAQITSSFRLLPGIKLGNRVELFGGPTFNYEVSDIHFYQLRRSYNLWEDTRLGYNQAMYIGLLGGLHFDI